MYDNKGKIVLITGGLGGIGSEICKAFLKDDVAGISILDLEADGREKLKIEIFDKYPGRVLYIPTDVTKTEEVEEALKKTVNKFGRLDIVINNAGIIHKDIRKTMNVNVIAAMELSYLALEKYPTVEVIINTSSIAALMSFVTPKYAASKCALLGFGRSLARKLEMEKKTTRIITVCPGATNTPIFINAHEFISEDVLKQFPSQEPSVVGNAIAKLTSEAKSGSVWVVENSETYEIEFQNYSDMRKTK